MGNSQSSSKTNYRNTMSFINSTITKNIMEVNNNCQQKSDA